MPNTETNRIENKQILNEDFEQEVIAFLNYREGGTIYVGIRKDGQAVGVENIDLMQLQIKDRIKNNIQPSTLGLFDVIVEKIEDKDVIKVVISSGTEKPYYLRKKGMCPEGCYIRIGSSKEKMTTEMIDNLYAKRVRNSLNKIESPRQDLTFKQLMIYYEGQGIDITNNFIRNLELVMDNGKYNYNGYLLADENGMSIKVARYAGTNKVDLLENYEFGYCSLIKATQSVIDKMTVENKRSAKITPKTRIEKTLVDSKALKEAIINAMVHNDYSSGIPPVFEIFSDRFTITSYGGLPQGIMSVYDKSIFEFLPNFLRINFYFDKEVLEYLGQTEQVKPNKLTEQENNYKEIKKGSKKSSKKSSKKAVSEDQILELCKTEKSLKEIADYFGYKDVYKFKNNYLKSLLQREKLKMTIPSQPRNRNQKYISK